MKQFIRDYLTFNKREKNGIFVLIALITLLIGYLMVCKNSVPTKIDFTKFKKEIEILESNNAIIDSTSSIKSVYSKRPAKAYQKLPVSYFNFNPNGLPEKEWKKLGLTDKQIYCIKNYERKGGTFRKKEDLKKMYLIAEKLYVKLEPYIYIPKEKFSADSNNKMDVVDINSADSAQLTQIKGIGPFYAKAIIDYRNRLGGFISKQQLLELWKFDYNKLKAIEKYIIIDTLKIKKININNDSLIGLKHPYLKWTISNAIVNYRLKHGPYTTIAEIKKTDVVNNETFNKLTPYLTIK